MLIQGLRRFSSGRELRQPAPATFALEPGVYTLILEPSRPQAATLTIEPVSLLDTLARAVGLKDQPQIPPHLWLRWPGVQVSECAGLQLPEPFPGKVGVLVRPWPVDLADPLPLYLTAGEELELQVRVPGSGRLVAEAEDGSPLLLDVGPQASTAERKLWHKGSTQVQAGFYTVTLANHRAQAVVASLRWEPPAHPLPQFAAKLPSFPLLTERKPLFVNFTDTPLTVEVEVKEPGVFRLESTGLLATRGRLRSPLRPHLALETSGGSGRNFLIQQYLRESKYQLTVAAIPPSRGRAALRLQRAPAREGGSLVLGQGAAAFLREGEGVSHRMTLTQKGEYVIRAQGVHKLFRCRLEDGEGWPLVTPGQPCFFKLELSLGNYRLVVLPEAFPGRVVTWVEALAPVLHFTGHGPQPLPLGKRVSHTWVEPEQGQERKPDLWDFSLPAQAQVTVDLSPPMAGELLRRKGGSVEACGPGTYQGSFGVGSRRVPLGGSVQAGAQPSGVLLGGCSARTLARHGEKDHRSQPAWLSVGEPGVYEIGTLAHGDVRGLLAAEGGQVLAEVDDPGEDFNVHIREFLASGKYRLTLAPVGATVQQATVFLRRLPEHQASELSVPGSTQFQMEGLWRVPLRLASGAQVLALEVEGNTSVAWHLEQAGKILGRREGKQGQMVAWLQDSRDLVLRLMPASPGTCEVQVRAWAGTPASSLWSNPGWVALGFGNQQVALLRVPQPGPYWLQGEKALAASQPGEVASARQLLAADDQVLLVAAPKATLQPVDLRAQGSVRFPLERKAPLLVPLPASKNPQLLRFRLLNRRPGLSVGLPEAPWGAYLPQGDTALALALPGQGRAAHLWIGDGEPPAWGQLEVWEVPTLSPQQAPWGETQISLPPKTSQFYQLPPGPKELRLGLPPGVLLALTQGDEVQSLHWGAEEGWVETLTSDVSGAWFVNYQETAGAAQIWLLPPVRPAAVKQPFFFQSFSAQGVWRLEIPGQGALHVRGTQKPATLLTAQGRILEGYDFPKETGVLLLPHGLDPVAVWEETEELFARVSQRSPERASLPMTFLLEEKSASFHLGKGGGAPRAHQRPGSRAPEGEHGPAPGGVHLPL